MYFFFQAEDSIRVAQESRGLGDVYKRQLMIYQRDRYVPATGLEFDPQCGRVTA